MTSERFDRLAVVLRAMRPRLGPTRLVAVDGPSGAGKTWFADRLAAAAGTPVVHTDDLLDGWDDQFTFWRRLEESVLSPMRQGRAAAYRRYDWQRGRFSDEIVRVEPAEVLIVEGVSSARAAVRPELSLGVFVSAPPGLCLDRVVARDGSGDVAFRSYLERWRRAEQRHFAADRTADHADLLVDGSVTGDQDRYERLRRSSPDTDNDDGA